SRRRHTRSKRDWSSDVCSSDLSVSTNTCFLIWGNVGGVNSAQGALYFTSPGKGLTLFRGMAGHAVRRTHHILTTGHSDRRFCLVKRFTWCVLHRYPEHGSNHHHSEYN